MKTGMWKQLTTRHGALALLIYLATALGNGAQAILIGERTTLPGEEAVIEALTAIDKGDLDMAQRIVDAAIKRSPENPAVWEMRGILKSIQGDLDGAEHALRKAHELAPEFSGPLTKLAVVMRAQGDSAQAKDLLTRALSMNRLDRLAHEELARILVDENDAKGAMQHYRLALADASPRITPLHLEYGRYLNRRQQYQDLIDLLEPLVDQPGQDGPEVRFLIASAYLELARAEPARRHVRQLRILDPDYPGLVVLEAVAARLQGDYEESAATLRGLLAKDPANAKVRYQLGLTLAAAGDWRTALSELEIAAAGRDDALAVHLVMARIRINQGQLEAAIADLETIAPASPEPAPYELLVQAHLLAGEAKEALAVSDTLVKRFPEFLPGHLLRVESLRHLGRGADALAAAARVTERFPGEPEAWRARANLLLGSGDKQGAVAVLERGAAQNPHNLELAFHLAALYQQAGRLAEAERVYRTVLAQHPDHIYSLNNLAALLSDDPSRAAEALALAERVYALAPATPAIQHTLGWARHLNGDDAGAVEMLAMAAARTPENPTLRCRLGMAYEALGEAVKARDALRRCLELNPSAAERKRARALLEKL